MFITGMWWSQPLNKVLTFMPTAITETCWQKRKGKGGFAFPFHLCPKLSFKASLT
jgi:hypothetical protein